MIKKTNRVMIDTLNELIGIDAAINLAVIYGGTYLFICNSELSLKRLTLIVGEENARKLIAEFKNETILIPKYAEASKKLRNEKIMADHDAGVNGRSLALKYELTERQVSTILNNEN